MKSIEMSAAVLLELKFFFIGRSFEVCLPGDDKFVEDWRRQWKQSYEEGCPLLIVPYYELPMIHTANRDVIVCAKDLAWDHDLLFDGERWHWGRPNVFTEKWILLGREAALYRRVP